MKEKNKLYTYKVFNDIIFGSFLIFLDNLYFKLYLGKLKLD
jgi:hypothetical protein